MSSSGTSKHSSLAGAFTPGSGAAVRGAGRSDSGAYAGRRSDLHTGRVGVVPLRRIVIVGVSSRTGHHPSHQHGIVNPAVSVAVAIRLVVCRIFRKHASVSVCGATAARKKCKCKNCNSA